MGVGLVLEATADRQKLHFKLTHPDRFCDVALYRMVRCPNYLGEIIYWLGVWFSGLAAYQSVLAGVGTAISCMASRNLHVDASGDFWAIDRDANIRF